MGKITRTEIKYRDQELREIGTKIKMPSQILTYIELDRPVTVQKGKTQYLCVITLLGFQILTESHLFESRSHEEGFTKVVPVTKEGKAIADTILEIKPREQKRAWKSVEEHLTVCQEALGLDQPRK